MYMHDWKLLFMLFSVANLLLLLDTVWYYPIYCHFSLQNFSIEIEFCIC